jgi:hypothetical protein
MDRLLAGLKYWGKNPVEAVKDWFNITPEPYQCLALEQLFGGTSARVAMKSAHGVGKTAVMSWAGLVFLNTRPLSRVPATAPTANQLMDILWPEFSKWLMRMPDELRNQWSSSATHIRHKAYADTWFATARTSNKPDNMQGFHNDHVLVLVDEAPGVLQPIYEVIEGILSSADEEGLEARILLTGNPTSTSGEFYNAFNKNKHLYSRITVSGDARTQFQALDGETFISKRVSAKYREMMAAKYGLGAVYDARVRGLFPRSADDVVIPFEWAERAQFVEVPYLDRIADPATIVMDVARAGGSKTTLGIYRRGHCLEMHSWPKTGTNECANILYEAWKHGSYGVGDVVRGPVIVDEPGVGGGVIDVAVNLGVPIVPYNGSAKFIPGVDPEDHIRMFYNRRARDWWMLRRKLEESLSKIPVNEDIVNELASVKYEYRNEKIIIENKRDMIERLGDDASPDYADNIVMGLTPYLGVKSYAKWDEGIEFLAGGDRATAEMDFNYHG